jgi:hypothetical protein
MSLNKKIILCILLALPAFAFGQENTESIDPIRMFVSATSGLRAREAPFLDSSVIATLPYGKDIDISQRSRDRVTIDGISDYWYRGLVYLDNYTSFFVWVFGGYLSDRLESDPVLGFWSPDGSPNGYLRFLFDGGFSWGMKETGGGAGGTFERRGDDEILLYYEGWREDTGELVRDDSPTIIRFRMIDGERMELSGELLNGVYVRNNNH